MEIEKEKDIQSKQDTKPLRVTFFLSTGLQIEIIVSSIKIKERGNELVGYEFDYYEPKKSQRLPYIKISEVVAITYVPIDV